MEPITFPFDTKAFFERWTKLRGLPKNDFEKQAILLEIVKEFDERTYTESEVNDILKRLFDDHVLVRRELINFGYMQRDPVKATYWVVKRTLTKEDILRNTRLARHAKAFGIE